MSKKIRLISLFSGFGTQEFAFKKIPGIEIELVNFCENDKKTSECFCLLHNENMDKNLGDITKLDIDKYNATNIDIITNSFPCQSFSMAGKKQGFNDEKNGNLYYHSLKILEKVKPKIIIFENVKNITSKKFNVVKTIEKDMERLGYKYFSNILNAINYGIPQNRMRWFMVCIRNDIYNKEFSFPKRIPLEKNVSDYIDWTINNRKCDKNMVDFFSEEYKKDYKSHNGLKKIFDGVSEGFFKSGFTSKRIYSIYGVSPTLTTSNDCHYYELKGKLTSKERFLLMGCEERYYDILRNNNISERFINKLSGNAIVVDVFYHLLLQIIKYF